MKTYKLNEMTLGWFIGNFSPSVLKTESFEVAIKHYDAGASEALHVHRVATEVTAVISGTIKMGNQSLSAGDIIHLEPGEATAFESLTDSITVVIKAPSAIGDKYFSES